MERSGADRRSAVCSGADPLLVAGPTAAAARTAAATAAATRTAAHAAATTTATATAAATLTLARLVDAERAAAHVATVERADRLVRGVRVAHFHECEPAGATGLTIGDHADGADGSVLAKERLQVRLRGAERKIAYVDPLVHVWLVAFLQRDALSC